MLPITKKEPLLNDLLEKCEEAKKSCKLINTKTQLLDLKGVFDEINAQMDKIERNEVMTFTATRFKVNELEGFDALIKLPKPLEYKKPLKNFDEYAYLKIKRYFLTHLDCIENEVNMKLNPNKYKILPKDLRHNGCVKIALCGLACIGIFLVLSSLQ